MDDHDLAAAFAAHADGHTHFTRRMAIAIAILAGETPRRIILRLEGLGLLRRGSWQWFADNGGITAEQVAEVRAGLGR